MILADPKSQSIRSPPFGGGRLSAAKLARQRYEEALKARTAG
jgi:hypothetical protein